MYKQHFKASEHLVISTLMCTSKSWLILSAVFADVSMKNIPFFSAYSIASFKMDQLSSPCKVKYIIWSKLSRSTLSSKSHSLPGTIQPYSHADRPYYQPKPWWYQDLHASEVPARHIIPVWSKYIHLIDRCKRWQRQFIARGSCC